MNVIVELSIENYEIIVNLIVRFVWIFGDCKIEKYIFCYFI